MLTTIVTITLVTAGITVALVPVLVGIVLQHRHDKARAARATTPITKAAPALPTQARSYEQAA